MSSGRATLTVLVADVVESTRLSAQLGPDRSDEVRRSVFSRFDEAIAAHHGALVKTMGDGCLATFRSASEGVASGVELIDAIGRLARQVPGLALRVGVAVGDVTEENNDVFGDAVVIATRLCAAASPGQVLTTDLLRDLVGGRGRFEWERVGALYLKGIDEPVPCSSPRSARGSDDRSVPQALRMRPAELFVGRHAAMEAVRRAWKEALEGERRAALISGEPGIGKTRLVAAAARAASEDGALVLFGRCEEDLAVPYQPFTDALRAALAATPRDVIAAHTAVHGGELRRLFPSLAAPDPVEASPETEQWRVIAALTDILERLAAEQPVVLVIDDIHWAAPATIKAIKHIVSEARPSALLVLATFRDTDVTAGDPLHGLLAELPRLDGAVRVSLDGLSRGEVEDLVEVAAGEQITEDARDLAHVLHERTAGNPFFTNQVLRHMVEAGALVYRNGRWDTSGAYAAIPDGVIDVVNRRLARLSPPTQAVLAVGAVAGPQFKHAVVGRCTDVDRIDVAIEEAVNARLINEDGRGGYRFSHAIVREALIESQSAAARARAHANIAKTLLNLHGDGPSSPLHDLALHACGAVMLGESQLAARFSLLAADACIHRGDVHSAIDVLNRAWRALDDVDPIDHAARFDVTDRLAQLHYAILDGQCDALEAAAASARALESPERLARLSLHAYRWSMMEPDLFARALIEDALAGLPEAPSPIRALALASGAYLACVELGTDPRPWTAEALAMIDELGGPVSDDLRLAWEYSIAACAGQPGARSILDRIEAVDGPPGAPKNRFLSANFLGARAELYLRVGDRAGCEAALRMMDAVAGTSGDPAIEGWVRSLEVILAFADARYDDAMRLAMQTVARSGIHVPNIAAVVAVGSMWLAYEEGRSAEIVDGLRMMTSLPPAPPGPRAAFAVHLCEAGLFDEARAVLDELVVDIPNMGHPVTHVCCVNLLATVCAHLAAAEHAQVLLDELEPYRGEIIGLTANVFQGATDRFRGPLLALTGRRDEGVAALEAAIALEESIGAAAWVKRSRYWLARVTAD